METSHTPKRHISRCKETYIYGKLLQCIKRDLQKNPPQNHVCHKRPVCIKRDLYIWKETYTRNPANTNCVKTNIYEKRLTKETYIHKRIPTYLKRDQRKKPRKHQLCRDQYLWKETYKRDLDIPKGHDSREDPRLRTYDLNFTNSHTQVRKFMIFSRGRGLPSMMFRRIRVDELVI